MSNHEEEKYRKIWELDAYRKVSPGQAVQPIFFNYFQEEIEEGDSIIDYGCGTGLTVPAFLDQGLDVSLVDIAPNCLNEEIHHLIHFSRDQLRFFQAPLWNLPSQLPPSSWSYCCDVLEHIPGSELDKTLAQISQRTLKGGFFQIFLQQEIFGEKIEEDLHPSLHDADWWTQKLSSYFPIYATLSIIEEVRHGFFLGKGILA